MTIDKLIRTISAYRTAYAELKKDIGEAEAEERFQAAMDDGTLRDEIVAFVTGTEMPGQLGWVLWVQQSINGEVVEGFLGPQHDRVEAASEARVFLTLEEIAAMLPTLEYEGCVLETVNIERP